MCHSLQGLSSNLRTSMDDSIKTTNQSKNYDEDNDEKNITPSVIRRGLCIFPMEGKNSI